MNKLNYTPTLEVQSSREITSGGKRTRKVEYRSSISGGIPEGSNISNNVLDLK
jgi:hypothetical protein